MEEVIGSPSFGFVIDFGTCHKLRGAILSPIISLVNKATQTIANVIMVKLLKSVAMTHQSRSSFAKGSTVLYVS
jgi:hypothetical protein